MFFFLTLLNTKHKVLGVKHGVFGVKQKSTQHDQGLIIKSIPTEHLFSLRIS